MLRSLVGSEMCIRDRDSGVDRMNDRRSRYDDYRGDSDRCYDNRRTDDRYEYCCGRSNERLPSSYNRDAFSGRGSGNGPSLPQWRGDGDGYAPTPRRGEFRGNFRGRGRPQCRGPQWTPPNVDFCDKCGRSAHPHPNMCQAINQNCRRCGRRGHFLRVCRTPASSQARSQ